MSRDTKVVLLSLALDLKRITIGYQSHSPAMAKRFHQEALRWVNDPAVSEVAPYVTKIIRSLPKKLTVADQAAQAEAALTYSLIIQNYALDS